MTLQEAQRVADAAFAVVPNIHTLLAELTIAFPQFVWDFSIFERPVVRRSTLTEEEVQTELENLPSRYGYWRNV